MIREFPFLVSILSIALATITIYWCFIKPLLQNLSKVIKLSKLSKIQNSNPVK